MLRLSCGAATAAVASCRVGAAVFVWARSRVLAPFPPLRCCSSSCWSPVSAPPLYSQAASIQYVQDGTSREVMCRLQRQCGVLRSASSS